MEEEAAFWCLAAVAEDVLPGYYEDDMLASAADQRVLATFVREKFPRVHDAFETSGAPLSAVTTSWFLALYVNQLPWETALRVWDVMLFERRRTVLFQVALALVDAATQKPPGRRRDQTGSWRPPSRWLPRRSTDRRSWR